MTPTRIKLLEEKREIEERKLGLQKYEMELRQVISRISEITYRKWENREQEKKSLQAQKRAIAAGLKTEYHLTPARIPYQLREYDHALCETNRQLDSTEQAPLLPQQEQSQDDHDR